MKRALILGFVLAAFVCRASLYTQSFGGGTIADGNPVGQTFTGNFTAAPSGYGVSSLTLQLNISGGYNGDLYAYLVAPNGPMVVLLNQPGGLTGSGMNVTLSDGSFTSIQSAESADPLSGTFNAVGSLGDFAGAPADGNWVLYFADLSSGGTSTLDSWSLNITAVPEPVNVALAIFSAVALAAVVRWRSKKV